MMVMDEKTITLSSMGLSQKEFMSLFWLSELQKRSRYPRELYLQLKADFPGKTHSYDYLSKVAKQMAAEGLLILSPANGKKYYSVTDKGIERLSWYQDNFLKRFREVKEVIDRILSYSTKKEVLEPAGNLLSEEYRIYFSKLVSVKDIIRYMALKVGQKRSEFYMSEIENRLEYLLGWTPSNSYLYHVSSEMEVNGLLVGRWPDEKRSRRYMRITEEGIYHFKQIEESMVSRAKETQKFLRYILNFLASEK
jgi:DNA-binding PadR family transcriptional regulator